MAFKYEQRHQFGFAEHIDVMPDDLYESKLEKVFPQGGPADDLFDPREKDDLRRADIQDTYGLFRLRIARLIPEIQAADPGRVDEITAIIAFADRQAFEAGIKYGNDLNDRRRRSDPNSAERVALRRMEAGI